MKARMGRPPLADREGVKRSTFSIRITASDIVAAIREQNVQVAAGGVGQPPVSKPLALELQVNAKGRLIDEEEFGQVIVKTGENGEKISSVNVVISGFPEPTENLSTALDEWEKTYSQKGQWPGSNSCGTWEKLHPPCFGCRSNIHTRSKRSSSGTRVSAMLRSSASEVLSACVYMAGLHESGANI